MELTNFTTVRENLNERNSNLRKENHNRLVELFEAFELNENNDQKRALALKGIHGEDWETPNATSFKKALSKSKHKEMLTDYSVSELSAMKLYKLKGFDIGYALKKKDGRFSEIVAVFNNEDDVKGVGADVVKSAIKNGGCFLDHYDGKLTKFYQDLGFVEYDRWKFDAQYDKDGSFRKKYGEADVIFRKYKNC